MSFPERSAFGCVGAAGGAGGGLPCRSLPGLATRTQAPQSPFRHRAPHAGPTEDSSFSLNPPNWGLRAREGVGEGGGGITVPSAAAGGTPAAGWHSPVSAIERLIIIILKFFLAFHVLYFKLCSGNFQTYAEGNRLMDSMCIHRELQHYLPVLPSFSTSPTHRNTELKCKSKPQSHHSWGCLNLLLASSTLRFTPAASSCSSKPQGCSHPGPLHFLFAARSSHGCIFGIEIQLKLSPPQRLPDLSEVTSSASLLFCYFVNHISQPEVIQLGRLFTCS